MVQLSVPQVRVNIRTLIIYTTCVDLKREMDKEAKRRVHEDHTTGSDTEKDKKDKNH